MFKKFKDKLAEEMKQSPARLQTSIQQLAQAVVSPSASNSSIQDIPQYSSNENFSLTEEGDETPKNSPARHGFQSVELTSPSVNSMSTSRRSSVSSVTSDASSLFPIYENTSNAFHLQSDMEQSASEVDESISPQLERVTKDQLYMVYRKIQTKYHKYRGRYTDLATHYRELERAKVKLEGLLVETQDKALRRVADLKEQCQLEQQAKAHLEEALRNDIEEKDHIINTLNTKIKILQGNQGASVEGEGHQDLSEELPREEELIKINEEPAPAESDESKTIFAENTQLKDTVKRLENLITKYKDNVVKSKNKLAEVSQEKSILERDFDELKTSSAEQYKSLEANLIQTREDNAKLNEQLEKLKKLEEDAVISLAENKLSIHRELDSKEEQIKQLRQELKQLTEENDGLRKKEAAVSDVYSTVDKMQRMLDEKEAQLSELRSKQSEQDKTVGERLSESEKMKNELKVRYDDLKAEYEAQKIVDEEKHRTMSSSMDRMQTTHENLSTEIEQLRGNLLQKDEAISQLNEKINKYTKALEIAKQKLMIQAGELKTLKENSGDDSEISRVKDELVNKSTEILGVTMELKSCKSTICDLREKIQVDCTKIDLLKKEKSRLIANILEYRRVIHNLKGDCKDLKKQVNEHVLEQNKSLAMLSEKIKAISSLPIRNDTSNYEEMKATIDELNTKLQDYNSIASKNSELESELKSFKEAKNTLEKSLEAQGSQVVEMESKNEEVRILNQEIEKLREELLATRATLEDLTVQREALCQEKSTLEQMHADETSKLIKSKETLEETLQSAVASARQQSVAVENLTSQIQTLEADKESLLQELRTAEQKSIHLMEQTNTLSDFEKRNEEILRKCDELSEKLRDSEDGNHQISQELENLRAKQTDSESTLRELEALNQRLNVENKEYKEKQNEYLRSIEVMKSNEESFDQRVQVHEQTLSSLKSEMERLKSTLASKNIEIKEFKRMSQELQSENKTLSDRINEVGASNDEKLVSAQKASDELRGKVISLEESLRQTANNNQELVQQAQLKDQKLSELTGELQALQSVQSQLEGLNNEIQSLSSMNFELQSTLQELEAKNETLQTQESEISREFKALQESNKSELEEKMKETEELKDRIKFFEIKCQEFKSEIEKLTAKNNEVEKQLQNEETKLDEALVISNRELMEENKKLGARLDEANITFQSKESQMQTLHTELKTQTEKLRDELKTNEEEQAMRIKQLVKEFQAQLHDKDEELQAALEKRFDRQQNYESDLVQQYREQLKDFQVELTAKSEQIENLIVENKSNVAEKQSEINSLVESLAKAKQENTEEVKEVESRWRTILKDKTEQLELRHQDEVRELTKEWQNERKTIETVDSPKQEELESTSRVAMAAVQSNTDSLHTLQQTLVSQRRELSELRKLVKMRHDTVEDSTEIEYLRNILYEYMMGKETVVLARVIAAVVKFDQDQTSKIMKKEEDKLTLLGSLGLT